MAGHFQARLPSHPAPKAVILTASWQAIDDFLKTTPHTKYEGCFCKLYALNSHPHIAIGHLSGNVKTLANKLQELIDWGVEEFISISTANSLQTAAEPASLLFCERAVRDESLSCNYLPSAKYIHAPRRLGTKVQRQLAKLNIPFQISSTWTVDNPMQKTPEEIEHYQEEGIATIEQEIATLFAIAHFYRVDLASLLVVEGSTNNLWDNTGENPAILGRVKTALNAAISTLCA